MTGVVRRMERRIAVLWTVLLLPVLLFWLQAQPCNAAAPTGSEFNMQIRNRIEVIASTERLSDPNGRWNSLNLNYFQKAREDTTVFAQIAGHSRPEGGGVYSNFGIIKDWSKSFYTQTSIGFGSNASYLPNLAIDQDFNFKFGKDNRYLWSLGASYFQYRDNSNSLILKAGFGFHQDKWAFDYRLFRNMSNPGSIESFSHLFSLAYGKEKKYWTTLTYSFGQQAYLASTLAIPAAVSNYSQYTSLNYRRWLGPHHGFIAEANFLHLIDAYDKLGFYLGYFHEY